MSVESSAIERETNGWDCKAGDACGGLAAVLDGEPTDTADPSPAGRDGRFAAELAPSAVPPAAPAAMPAFAGTLNVCESSLGGKYEFLPSRRPLTVPERREPAGA